MNQDGRDERVLAVARTEELARSLGWMSIDDENFAGKVSELPLGSDEERRVALKVLSRPGWDRLLEDPPEEERIPGIGTEGKRGLLGLYAMRLGAPAKAVAHAVHWASNRHVLPLVQERGPEFAAELVEELARMYPTDGGWGTSTALLEARIVMGMALPLPSSAAYLRNAMGLAAEAFDGNSELQRELIMMSFGFNHAGRVEPEFLEARFEEHALAARRAGISGLGAFPSAVAGALDRGVIARDTALDIAIDGLEAANKPRERKAWVLFLVTRAHVRPEELAERAAAMIAVLSGGDGYVNAALGPAFVAAAPANELPDVCLAALSAPTAKARKAVLKALALRDPLRSPGGAEQDGEAEPTSLDEEDAQSYWALAEPLMAERDRSLAAAAQKWAEAWGFAPATESGIEAESTADASSPASADEALARWEPTPRPWSPDPFVPFTCDRDGLRAAIADLPPAEEWESRFDFFDDLEAECFLQVLNGLAFKDAEAAKAEVLRTRGPSGTSWDLVLAWAASTPREPDLSAALHALEWRSREVLASPGRVPALLSTPSLVDQTVTAADLAGRLESYASHGWSASRSDLVAALLRLNVAVVSGEERARLQAPRVALLGWDGTDDEGVSPLFASDVISEYFTNPVSAPQRGAEEGPTTIQDTPQPVFPEGLRTLLEIDGDGLVTWGGLGAHPLWGDTVLPHPSPWELPPGDRVWRQLSRRARPLTPGAAMQLLGTQRAEGGRGQRRRDEALAAAWERGLLRPGIASLDYLDWGERPQRLPALVAGLMRFVDVHGAGAVAWSVLEQVIAFGLKGSKLPTGTSDAAEAMLDLAPAAVAARMAGRADADQVAVPALRALAQRKGNSRAAAAARRAVTLLDAAGSAERPSTGSGSARPTPDPVVEGSIAETSRAARGGGAQATTTWQPLSDAEFAAAWPSDLPDPDPIDDGVEVVTALSPHILAPKVKDLVLVLRAPEIPHEVQSRVRWASVGSLSSGWISGVARERGATLIGELDNSPHVWLSWDPATGSMRTFESPEQSGEVKEVAAKERLSAAVVASALAALTLSGEDKDSGRRVMVHLLGEGRIGSRRVAQGMRLLLHQEDARAERILGGLEGFTDKLPAWWSALREAVEVGAAIQGTPPRWLNRALSIALANAPVLAEAGRRGLIPRQWPGLRELAGRKGKAAAQVKARQMLAALEGPGED